MEFIYFEFKAIYDNIYLFIETYKKIIYEG